MGEGDTNACVRKRAPRVFRTVPRIAMVCAGELGAC